MDVIPKVVAEAVYKALVIDLFTNKAVNYNLKPFLNGNLLETTITYIFYRDIYI